MCEREWKDIQQSPSSWKVYFYYRTLFFSPFSAGNNAFPLLTTLAFLKWKVKDVAINMSPSPRYSFTGNCVENNLYFIGGQVSLNTRFDDVYSFDVGNLIFC
jgi:hypothetical protein